MVVIAPVATETPMLPTFMGKKELDDEGMTRYKATVPLGRLNQFWYDEAGAPLPAIIATEEQLQVAYIARATDGIRTKSAAVIEGVATIIASYYIAS